MGASKLGILHATSSFQALPFPLQALLCLFQSCFWCSLPQCATVLQLVHSLPGIPHTTQAFSSSSICSGCLPDNLLGCTCACMVRVGDDGAARGGFGPDVICPVLDGPFGGKLLSLSVASNADVRSFTSFPWWNKNVCSACFSPSPVASPSPLGPIANSSPSSTFPHCTPSTTFCPDALCVVVFGISRGACSLSSSKPFSSLYFNGIFSTLSFQFLFSTSDIEYVNHSGNQSRRQRSSEDRRPSSISTCSEAIWRKQRFPA